MRDDKKTKAQLLGELLELRNQIEALQGTETERARLTGILDSTTDYVGTATPDGRLTYMNREARHLLGWGEDEDLAGRQIADVHPSWALDSVFNEGISSALRDGIWGGETTLLRHDGVEIPVSQVIMAHRSPGGEVEYLSTIMRDMSEAKRAEQERLAHVRMLEALDEINQAFQGTDDLDQMMSDAL
ncbi:MAG: PAS domain S-box protein, partial [Proteobacteria bacterium]|nr:PAS domain S-box protein [Pseudomonadota bacterium]MBU1740087.1 PAS domain S-box protein [Pseudomonadota bacterium]